MSDLNYRLIIPPTVEPISLFLAKKQARVDIADDNIIIQTYISIAREYCESFCNRAFYTQTWQLWLDSFPYGDYRSTIPIDQRSPWNYSAYWADLAIRLPKPRALSIVAFNYLDANFAPQTLTQNSQYIADLNSEPARLTPMSGATWPITQFYQPGSINVIYTAGSYVFTITENVSVAQVAGSGPYLGTLSRQVISITSVTDNTGSGNTPGNPLTFTTSIVNDETTGDPTATTQISLASQPPSSVAVVTYQAGIMPPSIMGAMMLIIGHLYEHREENSEVALKTLPMGVESFLKRYKFDVMSNYRSGY